MVLHGPPALFHRARDLFRAIPVGVPVHEDVDGATAVAGAAFVVFAVEEPPGHEAPYEAGIVGAGVDRVPTVDALFGGDAADRVFDQDAFGRRGDRGIGYPVVVAGGRLRRARLEMHPVHGIAGGQGVWWQ